MNRFYIIALLLLVFASCKKPKTITDPVDPVCYSKVFGAYTEMAHITDTAAAAAFGVIDTTGANVGAVAIFSSATSKQGAYNNTDECYYTFKTVRGKNTGTVLCKVSAGSSVFYLGDASQVKNAYQAMVFNKVNSKMYCIYNDTVNKIGEVAITGGSFTVTEVARMINSKTLLSGLTADNNSGALYCLTGDLSECYIEKYIPGTAAMTAVSKLTDSWERVLGLRYNVNDNKLYFTRITSSATAAEICSMDPKTGLYTPIVKMNGYMDQEYFSAAIEPCHNEYILSTRTGIGWTSQMYARINMTTGYVYKNSMGGIYMGLDVAY